MTTRQDHAQGGRAREPGRGTVVQTDGDHDAHGAGDQAARRAAEALTRIAREATRIAQDGQALAEEAAWAAAQREMAADVVGAIAERARQLAETRQQLAEDAQHLAEDAQHLAEKNQHVAEKNQHVAEEAQYLAEQNQQLAEKNQHVAEEAQRTTSESFESLRLRTETLASVAHDLRTPLTSLVGRADLAQTRLARGVDLNPDRAWLAAQLAAVQAAATRLRGAIDELDDVVHLVAGRELALMRERVDVGLLAHAVAQGFALQRTVVVEAPDTPVVVMGDHARLDRVLQNLIGNAVKYSPAEAAVEVTVTRSDAAAVAVIAVRDGGIGIPAAEAPRIFERYYRASTARGIAGSGLGLAGAQAVVARHGGTIAVESAEGVGTTVTLTLPLAAPLDVASCASDARSDACDPAGDVVRSA